MNYSCQLVINRLKKLAELGIDEDDTETLADGSVKSPKKMLFDGQAIDNKELDFGTCIQKYRLNDGIDRVTHEIHKSQIVADARRLQKLPLF